MFFQIRKNIIFISLLLLLPIVSFAQKASAEFIVDMPPVKLPSGEQSRDGIISVFFSNQKLYVTNMWSGLQVLDVTDVKNPKEVGAFNTENRSRNCFVVENTAYLSSELLGVTILDITNPASILEIGLVKTEGDASYVVANSQYIYVAEETNGVNIYDISNPAKPKLQGGFDTPGWAWGLFLDGSTLYVADKGGGLIILDVSTPFNPKRLGQYSDMRYAKTVHVEDGIAYVANGADGLWIFDVNNPAFPKLISKIDVDGYVYHVFKTGNSVFLSNESKKRIDIINVTNPAMPVKEGDFNTDSKVYAAWKNDVYVYIAADTKTIIVRHNHPPLITDLLNMTVDENSQLIFSTEAFDQDGDEIYFEIENNPEGATFDEKSGVFNWTPTYDQSGLYPDIKITVYEKTVSNLSTSTTFKITANHINRAPSLPLVDDGSVAENQQILFTLLEGSDPDIEDKGKLVYRAENMPVGAQFDTATRTFSWIPGFDQSGVYTVDFLIEDPLGLVMRDGAIISVSHVDRKPGLIEIKDTSVDENNLLTFKLDGADPDKEDQDKLSYRAENLPQGSVFDPDSAAFSWTPTFDQSGEYKNVLFVFMAGALSDSTSLTITVDHINRPPVMDPITQQNVNENRPLSFAVSGSDPDTEDAGKLIFSVQKLPQGASFDADSQKFSWTPTFDQSGEYNEATFLVTDPSGLKDEKPFTIVVNHVNRTPLLADITPKSVAENTALVFELEGSDPDIEDKGKLVYSVEGLPEGAILDAAKFSWTPNYDQSGNYEVKFTVSDNAIQVTKNTVLTVNHVNRPPVLNDIATQSVDENAALTFTVSGSDPDKEDAGKFILSAGNLPSGAAFDSTSGVFSWTPTFVQSGEYTVTFVNSDPQNMTDKKETVITVNHTNRVPVLAGITAKTVDENVSLVFELEGSDPDIEDDGKLVYSAEGLPKGSILEGTKFSWTPNYDQSGNYEVTFIVSDAVLRTSTNAVITVNHINRPPLLNDIVKQLVDENAKLTFIVSGSDPDKEDAGKFILSASNLPSGAVFDAASGNFSWTPTFEQSGEYTVTFINSDPQNLTDKKEVAITVSHTNRTPVLADIVPKTVNENTALVFELEGSDPDIEDKGKLVYSSDNLPGGATLEGTKFSWTPSYDQSGNYDIKFIVSDAAIQATKNVALTVIHINRSPVLNALANQSVNENEALTFVVPGSDPDKEDEGKLNYTAEGLPDGAAFDANSHTLNWTPSFDQSGKYTVSFTLSDQEFSVKQAVEITVNHVNRPPEIARIDNQNVDENSSMNVSVNATDADQEDAGKLTISVSDLPDGASFDASSNAINWTPTYKQAGTFTGITVTATDASGATAETQFDIAVNNVNRDPEIGGPSSAEIEAGSSLSLSFSSSDPDNDDLSFSLNGAPSGMTIDGDGDLSWTPGDAQVGEHSINVVVSDGTAEASTTLNILVTAKPQPVPADTTGN